MQAYQDIRALFELEEKDLLSRKALMRKKEELLLHFELTEEVTVKFNAKAFDKNTILQLFEQFAENVEEELKVSQIEGLSAYLNEGKTAHLDYSALADTSSDFRNWLKTYLNHAYYLKGKRC